MTRGARTRIATNIYADAHGFAVVVQRGARREEIRFPKGTPIDTLRTTRNDTIERLELGIDTAARGSLAADVRTCLAALPAGDHRERMRQLLGHWLRVLGDVPRAAVTPVQIKTHLATFEAEGFAPEGRRKLRRALSWLYTTLHGPDGANPVRAVKAPQVRYDDPRGLPYDVIAYIFQHAPDRGRPQDGPTGGRRRGNKTDRPTVNLSKLRAQVMAYTGMHQIEIGRLTAADIDVHRARVWIGPRQKGRGSPGAWHPLIPAGVAALRALVAAGGLGPFDPRSLARSWHVWLRTAKAAWEADPDKAGQPWPVRPDARPYDLRHSVGTAVYVATGDIRAAQAVLRHRQMSTTDRYTRAGVDARVRVALEAFGAVVPYDGATPPGQSVTKRPPMTRAAAPLDRAAAQRIRGKPR